ncbi:DUF5996 family protein [Bradyrhizobium japonicum]|uniref:DUF5996 family protein n=1 Tax=Bradyrhizobium japonicum TaxID=375 RepID=UPI0034E5AE43
MTVKLTWRKHLNANWPDISFEQWRETCSALHIYSQIVGKYRLARTPWLNHSWHATLSVNTRRLDDFAGTGRGWH